MSDWDLALVEEYDAARPRLVRVAYAILGSHAEAEDVVADCWLRLVEADRRDPVRDVLGWATVAVSRAALDVLRSARVRREAYVGPWLPEPVVTGPDPAERVTLDESVRYALLVVLEQLSPAERTAWVLHDLFGMPFPEVADAVGRTPDAVRQLASRARRHVSAGTPRLDVDRTAHDRVVAAFAAAAAGGDLAALVSTLDPGVVLTSDGGGVVSAARRPVLGADRVARFLLGTFARGENARVEVVLVNGATGFAVVDPSGRVGTIASLTVDGERVVRVDLVRAPDKLAGVVLG
ncbi:RNA polymerase sigma factor SigJ [Nocardioides lianchengensis]|uniref:RNA polymerase sigma-70 factor, ECF subfamily n=1 Tax=Nocardioides lianchengensis TaxID=1045774 RepID=A0A1G6Q0R8_9ACTN|nr:RNA polymerase sigma factor SigJ [Nocardioides lianchengensis]NYG12052.1 RNA polymerase sigma-70 factor (ECF subfamily) [Nocardioides lianchengensis]SDC85953.1 RNA polymerase sigma-70 factor, ECF subfamily [Nocardioides lianchengensis]